MSAPHSPEDLPPPIPVELDRPKLIIGEGIEEVLVFESLLSHLAITDISVEQYGGKQKLGAYLEVLKKRPGFAGLSSLAVTRDADMNALAAFASVRDQLRHVGFSTPTGSGGIEPSEPRVGIMIFPDGENAGALEDICLASWREDALMPCIEEYFQCVKTAIGNVPDQFSKARVHAWLAAQAPPDLRLGIAAKKGLIDWENPAFEDLLAFIRAL